MRLVTAGSRIMLAGSAAVALATAAPHAACAAQHTIVVHLARGGPAKTEHGRLATISDRYDYLFTARKGAVLTAKVSGAAVRVVATYPDGTVNGPGFPETSILPQTGRYTIEVSPDQMAEGALGRFTITLRLR